MFYDPFHPCPTEGDKESLGSGGDWDPCGLIQVPPCGWDMARGGTDGALAKNMGSEGCLELPMYCRRIPWGRGFPGGTPGILMGTSKTRFQSY